MVIDNDLILKDANLLVDQAVKLREAALLSQKVLDSIMVV